MARSNNNRPGDGTELAVFAIDEALLELQGNTTWKLLESMMKRRDYGVTTATAQMQVVGKRHFGRKALPPGGSGGRGAGTRELFDTLILWRGSVGDRRQRGGGDCRSAAQRFADAFPHRGCRRSQQHRRPVVIAAAPARQASVRLATCNSSQGLPAVTRNGDEYRLA